MKSHDLPCKVESASLEPKFGNRFIAGGEDMWVHVFDFHTGEEIGRLCGACRYLETLVSLINVFVCVLPFLVIFSAICIFLTYLCFHFCSSKFNHMSILF